MPNESNTCGLPRRARWLSPPGAAALALLYLEGEVASFTRCDSVPRRVMLQAADRSLLDEAMAVRHGPGVLLTCHGGPAVRRVIESELTGAGFAFVPCDFWQAPTRFERELLELISALQGRRAVALALEALALGPASLLALKDDRREHGRAAAPLMAALGWLVEPPRVQLWGPANAGKSSLLNALCGEALAEVADEPGLTRDVIEGCLEHQGFVIRLFDAPGEMAEATGVDAAALELARQWHAEADVVLRLVPPPGAVAEAAGHEWVLFSRCDEALLPRLPSVSIHDPASLGALKERLVQHFFGGIAELAAPWRFALPLELREDLTIWAEGGIEAAELCRRWLSPGA